MIINRRRRSWNRSRLELPFVLFCCLVVIFIRGELKSLTIGLSKIEVRVIAESMENARFCLFVFSLSVSSFTCSNYLCNCSKTFLAVIVHYLHIKLI